MCVCVDVCTWYELTWLCTLHSACNMEYYGMEGMGLRSGDWEKRAVQCSGSGSIYYIQYRVYKNTQSTLYIIHTQEEDRKQRNVGDRRSSIDDRASRCTLNFSYNTALQFVSYNLLLQFQYSTQVTLMYVTQN